jgi:hypothetical protein
LTEERHKRHTEKIKASFVAITLVFLLTLGLFGWLLLDIRDITARTAKLSKATAHLSVENTKRIREIQKSRVRSCQTTYSGVRNVFRPFLPKHPTGTLRTQIEKFNRVINRLIRGCQKQTNPRVEAP